MSIYLEGFGNIKTQQPYLYGRIGRDYEKKIVFMDFKGKRKVPGGFSVEKENDKNLVFQKVLTELDDFYTKQK